MVEVNSHGDTKNQHEVFITGLSTDEKPLKVDGLTPPQFSQFYELDTGDVYLFDLESKSWLKMK